MTRLPPVDWLFSNFGSHLKCKNVRMTAAAFILGLIFFVAFCFLRGPVLYRGFPAVGIDKKAWPWFRHRKAVQDYRTRGKQIINEGSRELFTAYRGFEPIKSVSHESNILQSITRLKVTPSLNHLTNDVADEASFALQEQLGNPSDWQEAAFKPIVQSLVARLSARVFVGTDLCRNKEWLNISTGYAVDGFVAAYTLRGWPALLRWPISWFLPECRRLRKTVSDARRILDPVIKEHSKRNRQCQTEGNLHTPRADTIDWLNDAFEKGGIKGRWNVADAQLGLSIVAIHTTTELLTGALFDIIATGSQFVDELREEIIRVLGPEIATRSQNEGECDQIFNKTSLYEMKLLDSTLKESQRIHTRGVGAMGRVAEANVHLSDGSVIPKGAFSIVTLGSYQDEKLYPRPEIFNPRRFLDMRLQPGQEKNWQLVTTSSHHLGFGLGDHACPGRFLAANEVKIALVYLLMEYDWKLPGQRPQDTMVIGSQHQADAKAKVLFKKRVSEIIL